MKTIAGSILILSASIILSGLLQSHHGDELFLLFVCPPAIMGTIILIWGLYTDGKTGHKSQTLQATTKELLVPELGPRLHKSKNKG